MKKIIVVVFIFLQTISFSQTSAEQIIQETTAAINAIETLEYFLQSWEVFEKKVKYNKMFVKTRTNPFEVYLKIETVNNGAEVLYVQSEKKIIINPNVFPYKNIRIKPLSKIATKGMHHTIYESGFVYFNRTSYQK